MKRRIKIACCITMYNEEAVFLQVRERDFSCRRACFLGCHVHRRSMRALTLRCRQRTLRGIASQLDDLDPEVSWEEFMLVVMVDGREKMHNTVVEFMSQNCKLYDPKLLKDSMEGMVRSCDTNHKHFLFVCLLYASILVFAFLFRWRPWSRVTARGPPAPQPVTCHIFERSMELPKHSSQREYFKPLQMLLAVKEKNGGKLNSHLWFFSGFCRQIQPVYTFVRVPCARRLSVGTGALSCARGGSSSMWEQCPCCPRSRCYTTRCRRVRVRPGRARQRHRRASGSCHRRASGSRAGEPAGRRRVRRTLTRKPNPNHK